MAHAHVHGAVCVLQATAALLAFRRRGLDRRNYDPGAAVPRDADCGAGGRTALPVGGGDGRLAGGSAGASAAGFESPVARAEQHGDDGRATDSLPDRGLVCALLRSLARVEGGTVGIRGLGGGIDPDEGGGRCAAAGGSGTLLGGGAAAPPSAVGAGDSRGGAGNGAGRSLVRLSTGSPRQVVSDRAVVPRDSGIRSGRAAANVCRKSTGVLWNAAGIDRSYARGSGTGRRSRPYRGAAEAHTGRCAVRVLAAGERGWGVGMAVSEYRVPAADGARAGSDSGSLWAAGSPFGAESGPGGRYCARGRESGDAERPVGHQLPEGNRAAAGGGLTELLLASEGESAGSGRIGRRPLRRGSADFRSLCPGGRVSGGGRPLCHGLRRHGHHRQRRSVPASRAMDAGVSPAA